MVTSKDTEFIETRRPLIYTEVIDPDQESEQGVVDDDNASLDEEDQSASGDTGVIKDMDTSEA